MLVIISASILIVALAVGVATFNSMVRLDRLCAEAWSGIDIALKRRYDLIPNLVETARAFAKHEQDTFAQLINLRNEAMLARGSVAATIHAESLIAPMLSRLIAQVEAYPELRSSQNFLQLQSELVNTEDRIAAARRFYNANVRDFNILIETFPGMLFAGGRSRKQLWELQDDRQRQPVSVG